MRVAFLGKMRAGKNTAYNVCKGIAPGPELKFAEPLYAIQDYAQKLLGFKSAKDREFLQFLGTDWARKIDESVFVKYLEKKVASLKNSANLYVTDCRFPNEVEALKKLGFKLIWIERPDDLRRAAGASNEDHASENSVTSKHADAIVKNDDTQFVFAGRLISAINSLEKNE